MTEISQRQLHSQEKPVKSKSLKTLKICKKTYWAGTLFPLKYPSCFQILSINLIKESSYVKLVILQTVYLNLKMLSFPKSLKDTSLYLLTPDASDHLTGQFKNGVLVSCLLVSTTKVRGGSQLEESVRRHKQSWKQLMLIETVRGPKLVEKSLQ